MNAREIVFFISGLALIYTSSLKRLSTAQQSNCRVLFCDKPMYHFMLENGFYEDFYLGVVLKNCSL